MSNREYSAEHRRIRTERSNTMSNIEYSAEQRPEHVLVVFALTDAEKLDYLYQVAVKVGALVDSITPQQVEQVKRMQANPLISKLFARIVKG